MAHYPWTNLRRPGPDEVVGWICSRMQLCRDELINQRRFRSWNLPRRWCAYLLLTEAGMSSAEAAVVMNRSHQTILTWVRRYLEEYRSKTC